MMQLSPALLALALIACKSSSPPPAGSASGGANAPEIKACDLLTTDEIKQATGIATGSGKLQTTDTQTSCDWNNADGTAGVGIIVKTFDASLWDTLSSSQHAKPVSGIGEKAYKGVPHAGDLAVKKGGYEIDVGIVDFKRELDPPLTALEAGWVIAPGAQGKGYASEALAAAIAWFERTQGTQDIACMIDPLNAPSRRVAGKHGFVEERRTAYHGDELIIFIRPSTPDRASRASS
jgi:predicted acetyltransferase